MTDLLPHTTQPITNEDDTASYEMRAWMEMVDSIISTLGIFTSITVDSGYTALGGEFINAKRSAIISLPLTPNEGSVIIVRNGDGSPITIKGNGKNINGCSEAKICRQGTALVIHYFIDSNEWLVR